MNNEERELNKVSCPTYCSHDTHFEIALRYWKCEKCSTIWGVGLNKHYFNPVKYHKTNTETEQEKE